MKPFIIGFKAGSKVLEIGGGDSPLRDDSGKRMTFNMDVMPGPNVDLVYDISKTPWPFETDSFDGVVGKYCLEHLSWHDIEKAIDEIHRILRHNGKGYFFLPNTLEQAKRIVNEGINKGTIELIFGSQEFPDHGGVHKTGFSPDYAKELFNKAGFSFVKILSHPVSSTDMIVECYKIDEVFEREYFEDGTYGYKDYRDFATHYSCARIIEKMNPESVLSVGCGRGYVARILENHGIESVGMDISQHCYQTRAIDNFIIWDAREIPWKESSDVEGSEMKNTIKDKAFDLCFSTNFLEHIPEENLDAVIKEMARVSKRGLHGIHMTDCPWEEKDPDIDITHHISQSKQWWEDRFKTIVPDYEVKIEHPRALEYERPEQQPPISLAPSSPDGLIKLNLGSFLDMFYYGWLNIDILDLKQFSEAQAYIFQQHDLTKGLPVEDNSVDIIMSNHLIEHLTREEGNALLKECYRGMKPGGIIRTSVPDTFLIVKKYIDGNIWDYKYINVGVERAKDESEAFHSLLLAGHATVYDKDSLSKLLERIGFKEIKKVSPFESRSEAIQTQTLTTHPSLSCVIEAQK